MKTTKQHPGILRMELEELVLELARQNGAEYPILVQTSDNRISVMDADSGRVWIIELREL
jgi:hypothetical protein